MLVAIYYIAVKRVKADRVFDRQQEQLLQLLGEELKRPLTHIMQLAELGDRDHMIRAQAERALRTIDNVLLYKRLATGQLELQLEPVHVGSIMTDVLQIVRPHMAMSGCRSELAILTTLQPVAADRKVLRHVLIGLWQAFIVGSKNATVISCSAKRVTHGVRITLSSDEMAFEGLSLAKVNFKSTQPVLELAGAATDLLVAKNILELSGSKLTISRLKGSNGIGVTLPISRQLQFV